MANAAEKSRFLMYGVIAGCLGCASSLLGKLSVKEYEDSAVDTLAPWVGSQQAAMVLIGWRVVAFLLNGSCTAAMWGWHAKSLSGLSSVAATVVATGSNFLLTGVTSAWLMEERVSPLWAVGVGTIVLGLALVVYGEAAPDKGSNKGKKED